MLDLREESRLFGREGNWRIDVRPERSATPVLHPHDAPAGLLQQTQDDELGLVRVIAKRQCRFVRHHAEGLMSQDPTYWAHAS